MPEAPAGAVKPQPAVELRGLTKYFGGVAANQGVDLRVEAGTIHGIIGENGAGKSTAMNVLYGMLQPDGGSIFVDGQQRSWTSPADAIAAGLGMVHQHFMLAGSCTGLDNILLSAGSQRFGILPRASVLKRLRELARHYGLSVDLERPVEGLPVGLQQQLEILKLLYCDARILILDEPTAVLTPQETGALFANLGRLRDRGKTVLLVTHKLKEVIAFTQSVSVLRAGRVTGTRDTASTSVEELAEMMVGRKVALDFQAPPGNVMPETALEALDLTLVDRSSPRPPLERVSFRVRRGELVGIAGVEGNGQSELIEALLHPADPRSRSGGTVRFLGLDCTDWPARRIRALGVALIPEDRLGSGLLPQQSLADNFLLGRQGDKEFSRAGFLRPEAIRRAAAHAFEAYDVRPRELNMPAGALSGGNQQKAIIAREFSRHPKVIIAVQPTRGVDVGSLETIHREIVRARDEGAAVLLVSSELDELMALSDRILVMHGGRIVAEFPRGKATERELGLKMGGA